MVEVERVSRGMSVVMLIWIVQTVVLGELVRGLFPHVGGEWACCTLTSGRLGLPVVSHKWYSKVAGNSVW